MDMVPVMLGIIIFQLTFCVLGAVAVAEQKGNANLLIKLALFWNAVIFGGIYLLSNMI